jgi:hypothetical protein
MCPGGAFLDFREEVRTNIEAQLQAFLAQKAETQKAESGEAIAATAKATAA